jgi:tetratricopeptide (TPR) repeat protein
MDFILTELVGSSPLVSATEEQLDLPRHHFDPVTLHEVFDDVPAAQAYLAELADRPDRDTPEVLAVRVPLMRALAPEADDPDAELAEAERLGWLALRLNGGPEDDAAAAHSNASDVPLGAVPSLLRLAHVLQWRHRFSEADLLFGLALEAAHYYGEHAASIEHATRLEYLALQHWGTCRYDQALEVHADQARPYLGEALALFERALELRVEADPGSEQVAATRQAIRAARDRLVELGA